MILSDGYNYYIDLLLQAENLGHLTYFSNQLQWTDTGVTVSFPHSREDCTQGMAHCKCQHLDHLTGFRRVYIGDGISDTCAAAKCEQVYAKYDLMKYCQENGIACIPFSNFQDIIENETEILNCYSGVQAT